MFGNDYNPPLTREEIENLKIGPSDHDIGINSFPDYQLHLDGTGIVWKRPNEPDLNVTEELLALRKEVEQLKSFLGLQEPNAVSFTVQGIQPEDRVLVVPVDSEEDKFERAMKGLK